MQLIVSPHNDDAALFTAFAAQQYRPLILTVFDSFVQSNRLADGPTRDMRRAEDANAAKELGCEIEFGGVRDDAKDADLRSLIYPVLLNYANAEEVWLPAVEPQGGHAQHDAIGQVGTDIFGRKVHFYLTYSRTFGKSTWGRQVAIENGDWIAGKLRAMACYQSQLRDKRLGCQPHFTRDLNEYVA